MVRLFPLALLVTLLPLSSVLCYTSDIRIKEVYQRKMRQRGHVNDAPYPDLWFEQPLDHFDKRNSRTFKNRYFLVDTYYKPGGPVILYNAGEGPLSFWAISGNLVKVANETNALIIAMEHRYYGKSIPVPDFSAKSMQYLTVEQALADMAHFIRLFQLPEKYKQKLNDKTLWITMGGSYPGCLAAWMRRVYPRYVFAAYSSSAPVKAKLNFFEYDIAIQDSLPAAVVESLATAIERIDQTMDRNDEKELAQLKERFGLGELKYKETFASILSDPLAYSTQYGDAGTTAKFLKTPKLNKDDPNNVDDIINHYGGIIKDYIVENNITVADYNNDTISDRIEDNPGSSRQWYWQTCTQFGFWQIAPPKPFRSLRSKYINMTLYEDGCREIFGKNNVPDHANFDKINRMYGSDSKSNPRTFYINGEFDPWRRLSVSAPGSRRRSTPEVPIAVVEGGHHCDDMLSDSSSDNKNLTNTRILIRKTFKKWVKEFVPMPDPSLSNMLNPAAVNRKPNEKQ